MTNKDIARKFSLLGKLMELHGENAFKTKSYTNAYITLRKHPQQIQSMSAEEISQIEGVGKTISSKITELVGTGEIESLNQYLEMTPPGIIDMLGIKGFGAKKITTIWKELKIESVGELLNAIQENKLLALKGFGAKTQASLKEQLEYHVESMHKMHYADARMLSDELLGQMRAAYPEEQFSTTGPIHRQAQIVEQIDVITTLSEKEMSDFLGKNDEIIEVDSSYHFRNISLAVSYCDADIFYYDIVRKSCPEKFWNTLTIAKGKYDNEESVFTRNELPYIIPEYRENHNAEHWQSEYQRQNIITEEAIRGCIHNHSTHSDGLNTIAQMTEACIDAGYEYLVMTDHSKSAFYANGMSIEELMQQSDEIRSIDQKQNDIRVFTGVESDILSNGDLDYPDHILSELDVIIASVHSNLKMDEQKATTRLLRAIENPYTSILGHPTGRLLLSRKGYTIDHMAIINACADNNVAIEINANPNRLDIDWTYIRYAMSKGVLLSINPDAHSIAGIADTQYGVSVARKAGLTSQYCLNAFDLEEFEEWMMDQHDKRR